MQLISTWTNNHRGNEMKKTIIAISVGILVSGCATVQQTSDEMAQKMGVSKAGGGATVGAVLGCAGGAVLGYVTGVGTGKGCVAGAMVGGVAGYVDGRQHDLDDAKKLAADMNSVNSAETSSKDAERYAPKVETREVEVQQKDKPAEKVTAFKSLTVPIPPGSLHDRSSAVKTALGKIGGFASSRSTDTVIVVAVEKKDRKFVEEELNQGIASTPTSSEHGMKVGAQKTPTTHIKFVFLKKGDIPKITVAPVDVTV